MNRPFPLHGYGDAQQQQAQQHPTTALPIYIPGHGPSSTADPSRGRRTQCLLSLSAPANPDAILSRSLMEQCRLDDGGGANEGSHGIADSPRAGLKRAAWSTDSLCRHGTCTGNESWKQPSVQLPWSSSTSDPYNILTIQTTAPPRNSPPSIVCFSNGDLGQRFKRPLCSMPLCQMTNEKNLPLIVPRIPENLPLIVPRMPTRTTKATSVLSTALRTSATMEPHEKPWGNKSRLQPNGDTITKLSPTETMSSEDAAAEQLRVQNRIAQRKYSTIHIPFVLFLIEILLHL